jgi:outer membrane protein assembly factor BamB
MRKGISVKPVIILLAGLGAVVLAVAAWRVNAESAPGMPAHSTPTHPRATTHLTLSRLWQTSISPNADSAPAFFSYHGRQYLYVLAGNNGSNCNPGDPVRRATLYAFSAANGKKLWTRSTSGSSRCTTAGPAVDRALHRVYAPGLDGKLHAYNGVTGKEIKGHGWPFRITLMPDVEKISATPVVHGRYIYVTTSGFIGDQGHYEGHLVTVDTKRNTSHVFNSLCSNITTLLGPSSGAGNYCPYVQSGLFGRGQGVTDPVNGDVYIVSGNGPWNGHTNWGDSIMKLNPAGTRLVDSFTPTDQAYLNGSDLDLGSTGPGILPPLRFGGKTYHLLVQAGKGGVSPGGGAAIRLLNRDNLSGTGQVGRIGGDLADAIAPGGSEVLTAPAVWHHGGKALVFYANDSGIAAYRVTRSNGSWHLGTVWSKGTGGTTPIIHNGVLYVLHDGGMTAYDPATGAVRWSGPFGPVHWEYPLVTNGKLFATDENGKVTAYAIT